MRQISVGVGPIRLIVAEDRGEFYPRISGDGICLSWTRTGFADQFTARVAAVMMAQRVLRKALKKLEGSAPSVSERLDWEEHA